MGGSAIQNWTVFGNSEPSSEAVKLAVDLDVSNSSDTNKLRRLGWTPNTPGAYCKSFLGLTEDDVRKVCKAEPTAVDYVAEFTRRYP